MNQALKDLRNRVILGDRELNESEILVNDLLIENDYVAKPFHKALQKHNINGSYVVETEWDESYTEKVKFMGYDYNKQCWVKLEYFI